MAKAGDKTGKCPHLEAIWNAPIQRSTQPIVPTNDGAEYDHLVRTVMGGREEQIDSSAFRGDATNNFRMAARNVHLQTRHFYNDMMTDVGANIFPVMVLADADEGVPGGVGGMITVYSRNLSIQRVVPTPPSYELLKNLSHMSVGVFTVVSPWFRCPGALEDTKLKVFLEKVKHALKASRVAGVDIEKKLFDTAVAMYKIVEHHLEKWILQGSCTIEEYEAYAAEMNQYVPENIIEASAIQVSALYPELKRIKQEMGEEWEKLYVCIPTVWPVAGINPRVQILSRLMSPDQMNTRVFVMDNMSTMAQYRQTLGRVIGDRCSANLILADKKYQHLLYALASPQDLMSDDCDVALKLLGKEHHKHEEGDNKSKADLQRLRHHDTRVREVLLDELSLRDDPISAAFVTTLRDEPLVHYHTYEA